MVSFFGVFTVTAEGTSNSYIYDSLGNAVESPASYLAERVITGSQLGTAEFSGAIDMFERNGILYLLDCGNNRIIKLSREFSLLGAIGLKDQKGSSISLETATGLFVALNGDIYVADEAKKIVWIADSSGIAYQKIESPPAELLPDNFDYRPNKVVADTSGVIYVLSKGTVGGALQFDANLNFMGFYGSEKVSATAKVIVERFWRKVFSIFSRRMLEATKQFVPPSYVNFDIGADDFIYTIRDQVENRRGQVRKLNAVGNNILINGEQTIFGDIKVSSKYVDSLLVDIEVDSEGFISVLDDRRGRVFQYDQQSNLLFIFGGKADQVGTFKTTTAIESIDGKLVILDKDNATLTVFAPTPFALEVRKAVLLDQEGLYLEAAEPWQTVLKMNANYELANRGVGRALIEQGKYREAMKYFKNGRDKEGYGDAFEEYRTIIINKWFPLILLIIIILVAIPLISVRRATIRIKNEYKITVPVAKYPWYCMLHPFKGYTRMKEEKKGSFLIALFLMAAFFLVSIIERQATGFQFNTNRVDQFNIFVQFGKTIGVALVFVLANWMVSTIIDGKGTLKEVFIFGCYALMPYLVCTIPAVLMSNIIVSDEQAFYLMLLTFIKLWTFLCLFMAVKEVHQFSLTQTVGVILITVIGIILLLAIIAIVYSMFIQLLAWIVTIASELLLRL